jgi:DNA repair exonuclease SbcCD ATPase subunit
MDSQLSLTIVEIVVLMLGAIVLGITLHFLITSRSSFKASSPEAMQQLRKETDDWKQRYFNEFEFRDKELENLEKKLAEAEEGRNIYSIEAEETRIKNKKLQAEIETLKKGLSGPAVAAKPGYMDQLSQAQTSLREYNEKINQLLGQIDIVKETEEKQQEILRNNEELTGQINQLRQKLAQKEQEINNIRQRQDLTTEMNSRLEIAYSEFGSLQDKIQKLENQVLISRKLNMEYEELKEEHIKALRDYEDQKLKYHSAMQENQHLQAALAETEDKLREANFQRQQLQKKVAYL